MRSLLALPVLSVVFACSGPATTPPETTPAIEPTLVAAPASPPAEPPTLLQGEDLYNGCKERVEGTELAGECTTDADCSRAGCSQEVCVAAKNVGEVLSTCEVLPCFTALNTCGCRAGVCGWDVKSPAMQLRQLPVPAPAAAPTTP